MAIKCTYIHGVGSAQTIDTHGEIVDLAGLDITSLVGGPFSYEHEMGESKTPAQIVGKILQTHKIFSEKDCQNEHHLYFWNKCKLPFLYVMGRLFDDKKPSAKELAALFLDDQEHPGEHPMVSFSVEGSRILMEGPLVKRSIARKVTVTGAAANKVCLAQTLPIPSAAAKDDISSLFKGEMVLFQYEPTYTQIMEKKDDLKKAMTAGSGMAAPAQLEGGAALAKESLEKPMKKKESSHWYQQADQAYSTWDKKEHFRGYMKKRMPHLADGEIDAIGRVVALKKTVKAEDGLNKMYASYFNKSEEVPTSINETNEKLKKGTDIMMASEGTAIASEKEKMDAASVDKHPHSHNPIHATFGETKPSHSHEEMTKLGSMHHAERAFDHTMHAIRAKDEGNDLLAKKHRQANAMHSEYAIGDHGSAKKMHGLLSK